MEIYVKVEADREEGKQMSSLLVGEELVSLLEDEQVEVEESIYNVTSAEVVDVPKKSGSKEAEDIVWAVIDKYMDAHPIVVDGPPHVPTEEEQKALDAALMNLALSSAVGEFTKKARFRATDAKKAVAKS